MAGSVTDTVASLAAALGGTVDGDGSRPVVGVASLADAGPSHVSFLTNRRYAPQLAGCNAAAVLVSISEPRPAGGVTFIRVADPYAAVAACLERYARVNWPAAGIHPRAFVADDAVVDGAFVDALAVVAAGAVVGPGSWLEPGVVVGAGARVGPGCHLHANSVVAPGCVLGARVVLNSGAVVGGDGYGFAPTPAGLTKIPQLGRVVLEDDVELGANACVDRAALPGAETRIGAGSKLDNLVQVGHGAHLGEHVRMVAFSGVAGSARLGNRVTLAAKAAVLGHRAIGDGVEVGVASVVHDEQPPGAQVSGIPAIDHKIWRRAAVAFRSLPGLLADVRALARRLDAIERRLAAAEGGNGHDA